MNIVCQWCSLERALFQVLHQGTQQWVRSSISFVLSIAFWVMVIIHAKSGETGVWNPTMGGTFIVLDANCIGIRARKSIGGNISMASCGSENYLCCWLVLLMPLNVRMNLDDNSDLWGLIFYFLSCILFFALCKHILRYYLFAHGENINERMYKTMRTKTSNSCWRIH